MNSLVADISLMKSKIIVNGITITVKINSTDFLSFTIITKNWIVNPAKKKKSNINIERCIWKYV